jgi:hypothetical protein
MGGWVGPEPTSLGVVVRKKFKPLLMLISYIHGYFSGGMHRNAVLEVLSQKDTSQNGIPEPFFLASI